MAGRWWPLMLALMAAAADAIAAPTSVSVSSLTFIPAPSIASGTVNITWVPDGSSSVASYAVTVAPLDAQDDMQAAARADSGWMQDFGSAPSSITGGASGLQLHSHGAHDVSATASPPRSAPRALRKVPLGSIVTLEADCSGLASVHSSSACGLTVFDAGSNSSLLSIVYSSASGTVEAWSGSLLASTPALQGDGSTTWASTGGRIRIRLSRGPAGVNRTWTAEVTAATGPTAGVSWTNLTVRESLLGQATGVPWSWNEGDLWHGPIAYAWAGSGSVLGMALFPVFHTYLPVPRVSPTTLYGAADTCLAGGTVRPVTVTVPGSQAWATVTGLSGYFPYTVSVVAVEAGSGAHSPASAPIPGLFFYPRSMPPRSHMLGYWLDTKNAPGGAIARIPDASMRGHDLLQSNVNLRPTVLGGNLYSPSTLRFTRSRGHVLASGLDALDLGIGTNFTVYLMARGTTSVPQVVLGRGGPATTITGATSPGWGLVIYNDLYNPYPGFLVLKSHVRSSSSPAATAGGPAGGEDAAVKHGWWIPNTAVSYWWVSGAPVYTFTAEKVDAPAGAPSSFGTMVALKGWRDDDGAFQAGMADAAGGNTTGWPGVWWNGTGQPAAGAATNADLSFRVGSSYSAAGVADTLSAFDGDLYQALIYREAHSVEQQREVRDWIGRYHSGQQCQQRIAPFSAGVDGSGTCTPTIGGFGSLRCTQYCRSGFQYYLGTWGDHYCSNGAWTGAPLLCKRGCGTAMPPLYTSSCYRSILSEDFSDADSALRFITWPALPWPQRAETWTVVNNIGTGGVNYVAGNTAYSNACARMVAGPSLYGIHPTRWNDWYLPWGTQAFVSLRVFLENNNTRAGLAMRVNDQNTHYRAVLSSTGLVLERVSGGRATVIGRSSANFTVPIGAWVPLEAVYNMQSFVLSSNNVTLISAVDGSGPATGSVGFYLDGQGRFANLTVNSSCDAFFVGRNMVSGMSVTYKCRPGYTPLGNETWTCGDDGTYGGAGLICRSRPPVFGNYTFSLPERSPNGTLVGVATAWPAGPDQTVTYELVAQYPPPVNGSAPVFIVVGCSGAIRVADPYALDYQVTTSFNLTLKAVPDGQEISAAYGNVTILVTNVVDPPQLLPTMVYINETQTGAVSGPVEVYNPDKFTLEFSIGAGDVNSVFTIDRDTGLVFVKAPGLSYVNGDTYDLLIQATAVEDRGLVTNGILTINVIDVNSPPIVSSDVFYTPEGLCTAGSFLGVIPVQDVDIQSAWNNASLAITRNANKGSTTAIFRVAPTTGALYFDKTLSYTSSDPVYWFGDKRARDIFDIDVAACDNGGLCTQATIQVVVLLTGNVTSLASIITGMSWPSTTGIATAGGDIIRFLGRDFPLDAGALITADYGSTALGVSFRASNCFVKSDTQLQCSAAEGYGAGLTWRVFINAQQVPSSVSLVTSYAPPVVTSVALDTTGLTTSGSGTAALVISGDQFGMAAGAVTIRIGAVGSGASSGPIFTVPTVNSVTHGTIRATLGPGCGADLGVEVTVGGQVSSTLNPTASRVSYPLPSITSLSVGAGYQLLTLPTSGAIDVTILGSNLGPATLPSSMPLTVRATYENSGAGAGGPVYSYDVACRKDDVAAAHSRIVCPLASGVGTGFTWSLDVCGQTSAASAQVTGYAPPVLTRVSGPGAQRANTEGLQSLTVDGGSFGPVCCDASNPPSIVAVQYGTPGVWQYSAQACAVTSSSPAQMQCLTGPGTGKGHSWRINIGGQWSEVLHANTSYSPPILYNFAGSVDDAPTAGGSNITIVGSNFGDSMGKISVTYVDRLTEVSAFTGQLPIDADGGVEPGTAPGTPLPPGHLVYTPPWCVLTQPHKAITCGLQPGGGTGISWVVVVDEQVSTAPTTSYGVPRIDSVSLAGGGTVASSDGGELVSLRGTNLGEPHLIQAITYGPTGRDYSVAGNFTWRSHYHVDVRLSPSIPLGPMSFIIMVADQPSDASVAALTIAQPSITLVEPADGDTESDPLRPILVKVTGLQFGLLDTTAEFALAFGNAADRTLLPLIAPAGRTPSLMDVTRPEATGWTRPPSPIPQSLVFALPSGLGKERAVRVVAYRRGAPPSLSQVASMPTQGPAAVFSYRDPYVDYIVVLPTSPDERNATIVALGGPQALNGSDPNAIVKLEVNGRFFGPDQSVNRDGVQRIVEENLGGGRTSAAPFVVGNWSHRLLTVYSLRPSGTVRVRIVSSSSDGARTFDQTSAWSSFSDISPAVSGIIGQASGFGTPGGESISFSATGLGNAVLLNVTVGGRRCPLLDAPLPGGRPVLESDARARLIVPQGLPPAVTEWTLHCVLPEGQGTAPVVVIRDGVRSSAAVVITYAPPTVTGVAGRDADSPTLAPFVMRAWAVGVPVIAPTTSNGRRTVRLEGSNMGTCPSIRLDLQPPVRIDACLESSESGTGKPILTPNPSVVRDHTFIEFVAPDGVGTGLDVQPPVGWTLTLSAGGQDATNGALLYRHMPPIVTSISPGTGSTRGGAQLTITARQLGAGSNVPQVALGSARRAYMPCMQVVRVDATTVTCTQPEGTGLLLNARVTVADLSGLGGVFNYTPPSITSIAVATVTGATIDSRTNATRYTYSAPTATLIPDATAGSPPPVLRIPAVPSPDTVLIFTGDSFGPQEQDNCVFAAWADRMGYIWVPGSGTPQTNAPLVCNGGTEDFLGEGQVAAPSDVLEWSHTQVVVRAPRGTGTRVLTIRAGGQAPAARSEYPSLVHEPPVILGPCAGLTELNTNGGGRARIPALHVPRPPFGGRVYGDAADMAGTVDGSIDEGIATIGATMPMPVNGSSSGAGTAVPWLDLPSPLPLHPGFQSPTEHVVVTLGTRCLTSAVDLSGAPPNFIAAKRCIQDAVLVQSREGLVFRVPPGVGANKTVNIIVYSATGREVSRSSPGGSFSYDPPAISRVEPSPVYVRLAYVAAGSGDVGVEGGSGVSYASQYVSVLGKNFGRLSDSEDWTEDERRVSVKVAGVECQEPERIVRMGTDLLQCKLDAAAPVGRHNVSVMVGGQEGSVPGDERGLFIVCAAGLFGFVGDACLPCPLGADCPGFLPDEGAVRASGLNVSAGPIRLGRVQFDVGGLHMGPIPRPGFYNLNETDAECPPVMRSAASGRSGVCIVPCMDPGACLGDNVCGEAYASLPPLYRCSSCAKGFFRRAGECERCPQNAAAQFLLLILVAVIAGATAYALNKYRINPAFISIGLDFFQVVAIFANSKVKWPAAVKELFYILSAFNLNLELLAPECFLPDVTFVNKFGAIMSMPIAVYVLFLLVHGVRVFWKRVWKGQTDWVRINAHLPSMISASLLLLYVLYLYVTKTILDVFNCVPTEPPTGVLYLQALPEECGKPGGAQMTLYPYAILCCIVFVVGYPLAVAQVLWAHQELVMEDQLLRAKGVGEDRITNPHAYDLRRTVSRIYFLFKPVPNRTFWVLAILLRKFLIAFVSLIFSRNTAFQMAAALLVLFLAYAAQVRYQPYMGPDEAPLVIKQMLALSVTSPLHNRLRATLAMVEQTGRKRAHTNTLVARGGASASTLLRAVAGAAMNLNFVEASLLFACCLVNMAGLLYEAARPSDSYYSSSRDGVTFAVLFVIAIACLYWFSVMVADISAQIGNVMEARSSKEARSARAAAARKLSKKLSSSGGGPTSPYGGDGDGSGSRRMPTNVFSAGLFSGPSVGTEVTQINPMFTKKEGKDGATGISVFTGSQAAASVAAMVDVPDLAVWNVIREQFLEQHAAVQDLGVQLTTAKAENARLKEAVDMVGLSGIVLDPREAARNAMALQGGGGLGVYRPTKRRDYAQTMSAKEEGAAGDMDDAQIAALFLGGQGGSGGGGTKGGKPGFLQGLLGLGGSGPTDGLQPPGLDTDGLAVGANPMYARTGGATGSLGRAAFPPTADGDGGGNKRSSVRLFGFEIGDASALQTPGSASSAFSADSETPTGGMAGAGIGAARGAVGSIRNLLGMGAGKPDASDGDQGAGSATSGSPSTNAAKRGSVRNLFSSLEGPKVSLASLKASKGSLTEEDEARILGLSAGSNPLAAGNRLAARANGSAAGSTTSTPGKAAATAGSRASSSNHGDKGAASSIAASSSSSGGNADGDTALLGRSRKAGGRLTGKVVKKGPAGAEGGQQEESAVVQGGMGVPGAANPLLRSIGGSRGPAPPSPGAGSPSTTARAPPPPGPPKADRAALDLQGIRAKYKDVLDK